MTMLIATIAAQTPQQAAADIATAVREGAEAIELRVDCLQDADDVVIRGVAVGRPKGMPLVLTIRSREEGGAWDGDDRARIARIIALGPMADYLDVEYETWQRSPNIRQKLGLARTAGQRDPPARLILSTHDFRGRPATLTALAHGLWDVERADAAKVAWMARTVRDNFEAFELLIGAPKPTAAICMGEAGQLSRILAKKFGALATYASVGEGREAAPGQVSVRMLREVYRWDAIGPATAVYGVVGQPVAHSMSPVVHNAAFGSAGVDAVYVPVPVAPGYESFKAFMVEALARPWFDLRGLSVTAPHKENALRFVRESGGAVEDEAGAIGAVNTIKFEAGGALLASNTDCAAAMATIRTLLHCDDTGLRGRRCAVLGAGGVARAIVAGLTARGAAVRVFNRTPARAEALAREFGCEAGEWAARDRYAADLLVNCTSAGQWPAVDETPIPGAALRPETAVFDTVYHPVRTWLLSEAAARGCATADGLSMFIEQAARQWELWTGRAAPRALMRSAAERFLTPRDEDRQRS